MTVMEKQSIHLRLASGYWRNERGVYERILKYSPSKKSYLTQVDGWQELSFFEDKIIVKDVPMEDK